MIKAYLPPTLTDPKIVEIEGTQKRDYIEIPYSMQRFYIGKGCYLTQSEAIAAGLSILQDRRKTAQKQLEKIDKLEAKFQKQLEEMGAGNG